MFAKLLETTKAACQGTRARSFSIGIGLTDLRVFNVMISDLTKILGDWSFSIVVYHAEGSSDGHLAHDGVGSRASANPEQEMISDLKAGKVHAIIRGQLSSSTFLLELKRQFSVKHTYRLALLSTSAGQDFFFAPVGIDEAGDQNDKQRLIEFGASLLAKIGITPSFYLLSAGRLDDVSRGEGIARSIKGTAELVEKIKQQHPSIAIQHGEILIESAFEKGANVIIAPDGISGNLIYRTLLHLGSGHSHGAFYLGQDFPGPVLDTSRAGSVEEYVGAIVLAFRLLVTTS